MKTCFMRLNSEGTGCLPISITSYLNQQKQCSSKTLNNLSQLGFDAALTEHKEQIRIICTLINNNDSYWTFHFCVIHLMNLFLSKLCYWLSVRKRTNKYFYFPINPKHNYTHTCKHTLTHKWPTKQVVYEKGRNSNRTKDRRRKKH